MTHGKVAHVAAVVVVLVMGAVACEANASDRPPDAASVAMKPADPRASQLGLFTALGLLGGPGADGAAFLTGLRLALGQHFAASLDVGYGLESASTTMQDRWWVIPSASLVIPVGIVRLDLGAGAGAGTSSGYVSWSDYAAKPFAPVWHYTVPAVRGQLAALIALTSRLDAFARFDVASLVSVGPQAGSTDTTWFALWVGVQPRLL